MSQYMLPAGGVLTPTGTAQRMLPTGGVVVEAAGVTSTIVTPTVASVLASGVNPGVILGGVSVTVGVGVVSAAAVNPTPTSGGVLVGSGVAAVTVSMSGPTVVTTVTAVPGVGTASVTSLDPTPTVGGVSPVAGVAAVTIPAVDLVTASGGVSARPEVPALVVSAFGPAVVPGGVSGTAGVATVSAAPSDPVAVVVNDVVVGVSAVGVAVVSAGYFVGGVTAGPGVVSVSLVVSAPEIPLTEVGLPEEVYRPGDEFRQRVYHRTETGWGRVYHAGVDGMAQETLYITDAESKTFGFDYTPLGAVRGGAALAGTPTVTLDPAGPAVVGAAVVDADFYDSDGRRIRANKGAKARVSGATAGETYKVVCLAETDDGDVLEVSGRLVCVASGDDAGG